MIETIMAGAELYGAMEGGGMFGGGGSGVDASKAISGGPWYQGEMQVGGSDDISKFAMIGVVILLIILLAKAK